MRCGPLIAIALLSACGLFPPATLARLIENWPYGDNIKVLHFRLQDGQLLEDGPLLVSFRREGFELDVRDAKVKLGAPEYLLFLSARKDGRYEPVSGRIDPELSVRELHPPLPRLRPH